MRCSCCDKELTPSESTAKYVEADGSKPHRYVDMCTECRGFLHPETKFVSKPVRDIYTEPEIKDGFDLQDYSDEDDSWQ